MVFHYKPCRFSIKKPGIVKCCIFDNFVTLGKEEFSNTQNANINKWEKYIKAEINRQGYWERALEWVSEGKENIPSYMRKHRQDDNIDEVKINFNNVIDWVADTFLASESEMKGLELSIYQVLSEKNMIRLY